MTKSPAKMTCSECGGKVVVISTYHRRRGPILITRRRKCVKCDYRFTTYEVAIDRLADMLFFERLAGEMAVRLKQALEQAERAKLK